ncbi:MAG: TPR-repeat-containing protein [Proteobacteria bacterium]|nr:TPR-repeat-containing protein [Pseudomonadota bacterium]
MQGLALARDYYHAYRDPLLAPYAAYRPRIAAGLVGLGSECFGFDDEHSRDHDFGPGFCLWLHDADYAVIGAALQADYDRLPRTHAGFPARQGNARSGKRVGVFSISAFYSQFLGAPELPISDSDWLQIPEDLLATAVNGEVFEDPSGAFTAIRKQLQAYYPESIKRLKLATAAAKMAQRGQYNLPRAVQRGERVTALLAQAKFIEHTCRIALALHGQYAPFYKWLHQCTRGLPSLPNLYTKLDILSQAPAAGAQAMIEDICADVLRELIAQGYTRPGNAFLETHVDAILGQSVPSTTQDIAP